MAFWTTLLVAIALFVGGFFAPPRGVIDGSILTAAGELLGFAALAQLPAILKTDKAIKVTKGDTSIEVTSDQNE